MCAVSAVTDHYRDRWSLPKDFWLVPEPTFFPLKPLPITITPLEWAEYQRLKREAEQEDLTNGEPDCVKEGVAEWEAAIQAYLAVTNDEVD